MFAAMKAEGGGGAASTNSTSPPDILSFLSSVVAPRVGLADVAAAAVVLFISSAAVQWLIAATGLKKGPMMWPIFGIIPHVFFHSSGVYDWISGELRRSGGTFAFRGVWFGRYSGVITADPGNLEHMLKTRFANFPKGRYYRERFSDFLGDGIFNADDDTWRRQRRAAAAEMHSAGFSAFSDETVRRLVDSKLLPLIEELAVSSSEVDLQDLFLRFTFDNICAAAFGVDPGCLEPGLPVVPFAKAFEEATELTLFRFVVPPFVWKPMKKVNVGTEKKLHVAIREVHAFAENTVSRRREEIDNNKELQGKRSDLLARLMEVEDDVGEEEEVNNKVIDSAVAAQNSQIHRQRRFSDKFLKDFCISFILAGRDTSSVALTWFFWLLHRHPAVESRILDELRSVIRRRRRLAEEEDVEATIITSEDLKLMEYLQAALSESLRLYPSVPVDFKEVKEDDVLPSGDLLKKGDRVIYSIYSMARMPEIWGTDCGEFRPERWMRGSGGEFVGENQFKFAVFNGGPRLCVGKKFAYTQMKMVAASILLRYSVDILRSQKVEPKLTTTLYMKNGLRVRFVPREVSNN